MLIVADGRIIEHREIKRWVFVAGPGDESIKLKVWYQPPVGPVEEIDFKGQKALDVASALEQARRDPTFQRFNEGQVI